MLKDNNGQGNSIKSFRKKLKNRYKDIYIFAGTLEESQECTEL